MNKKYGVALILIIALCIVSWLVFQEMGEKGQITTPTRAIVKSEAVTPDKGPNNPEPEAATDLQSFIEAKVQQKKILASSALQKVPSRSAFTVSEEEPNLSLAISDLPYEPESDHAAVRIQKDISQSYNSSEQFLPGELQVHILEWIAIETETPAD